MKTSNKLSSTKDLFIFYTLAITFFIILISVAYYFTGNDLLGTSYSLKEIIFFSFSFWVALLLIFPFFIYGWKKATPLLSKPFLHNKESLPDINTQNNSFIDTIFKQYGRRNSKKFARILLVGPQSSIEKLAPHLTSDIWQENNGTLLIYGGDITPSNDETISQELKQLRRRRPLDGVIWVTEHTLTEQPLDTPAYIPLNSANADIANRYFHHLFQQLHYQAPIWVWNMGNHGEMTADQTPPILYATPPQFTPDEVTQALKSVLPALSTQGTQAVLQNKSHTYLLALARLLQYGGSQKIAERLAPLLTGYRTLPFAGMLFSPPTLSSATTSSSHHWTTSTHWNTFLNANAQLPSPLKPAPLGLHVKQVVQYTAATAMIVWGVGMALSYWGNRQLIENSREQVRIANNPQLSGMERLNAQYQFQQRLGVLDHREQTHVPLWLRFGLSQNQPLLTQLWPVYQSALLPLLQTPIRQQLTQTLTQFAQLPPDSEQRANATQPTYQALKAYLMMSQPEHMDADFFTQTLLATFTPATDASAGEWQTLGKELLHFYADQLPHHPEWTHPIDRALVSDTRTLLIRQMGQRNEETALYQHILQQAHYNYADMTLNDMVADTDVTALFTTEQTVPGIFTRKAWEGSIEPAIKKAVNTRRNEIDWVLSDNQQTLDSDIDPEKLKERLTARYFADFSGSWLAFLNSLKWRNTDTLADTIDQLTLMSDVRQSPVIALMNTLAYQGKTGRQQEKLTDSFVNSASELLNQKQQPVISQKPTFTGPLEPVFEPVLNFIDPQNSATGDTVSLQAYLTRVTRVRLKLQQVANAPDPQAMSQALAQSIFQGKSSDLTQTWDYGQLIAASLGQEWHRFGETLLVEPMTHAWQQLLTPTAQGINSEWQNAIVTDWNSAFSGRYPFSDTQSDSSLPLMAQYLKPDTGRIQRFLETRLQGVLRKEGQRWVPNTANTQGLRFNPEFLTALNTLSELGDVAFANGEARLYFELRPNTHKNVMETILAIDKQTLTYQNQRAEWQRFVWPADTVAAGASLSWMSTTSGTRLYADHPGVWGFIRLLDSATVTPYAGNTSSYTLSWPTLGGTPLQYTLRTEMGEGPLALLKLRHFTLPTTVFLDN